MAKTVGILQSEIVEAVRGAMIGQLQRDGHLRPGMEIGLRFYSTLPYAMDVEGSVRVGGQVVHRLHGTKDGLCTIAAGLALAKLLDDEKRGLHPQASVHWRAVRFTTEDEVQDALIVDVTFLTREEAKAVG